MLLRCAIIAQFKKIEFVKNNKLFGSFSVIGSHINPEPLLKFF